MRNLHQLWLDIARELFNKGNLFSSVSVKRQHAYCVIMYSGKQLGVYVGSVLIGMGKIDNLHAMNGQTIISSMVSHVVSSFILGCGYLSLNVGLIGMAFHLGDCQRI